MRAETIHVCPTGCGHANIQEAIDAAADGDIIQIATGTYYEHEVNTDGKSIIVSGETNADGTPAVTIDGQLNIGSVLICANGESGTTIIEHLVITGGLDVYGGGMRCTGTSPTLRNIQFTSNTGAHGGGMSSTNGSPILIDCSFTDNLATIDGGGMSIREGSPILENCQFSDNDTHSMIQDTSGGGMYIIDAQVTLLECAFNGNTTSSSQGSGTGGGVTASGASLAMTNCSFDGNQASRGGGMYAISGSTSNLIGCTFSNNSVAAPGLWRRHLQHREHSNPEHLQLYAATKPTMARAS